MELVCQHCENVQEEIRLGGRYTCKRIDGVSYIKMKGKDWEPEPKNICKKCGEEIEKKVDFTKVNMVGSERNDPNHVNFWKKGKTDSEVASVIAGETDPY